MAYSKDFRERALRQCLDGYTDDEVSKDFGISKHTLGAWKRRLVATGSLEKKKPEHKSGTPYKYKHEQIRELLDGGLVGKVGKAGEVGNAGGVGKVGEADKADGGNKAESRKVLTSQAKFSKTLESKAKQTQGAPTKQESKKIKDKKKNKYYDYAY